MTNVQKCSREKNLRVSDGQRSAVGCRSMKKESYSPPLLFEYLPM